jgi:hypothetical protein
METQTFAQSKTASTGQSPQSASQLGASLRSATLQHRLASVPKNNAPLFTREQRQFLGESLILIGSGLALLFLLFAPGTSRASAFADTAISERVQFMHEDRAELENSKNRRIEVVGTLTCTSNGGNSQTCAQIQINETSTGATYTLKNADGVAEQFALNRQVVRVTGTTQQQTAMSLAQGRTVAGQKTRGGDTIDVNTISAMNE